jgi:flagellar biosynthesis protein FliR
MKLPSISWHEGTFADLWSFVHVMSGIVGGTGLLLIHVPEAYAWCTAIVLTIVWEIYEWKTGMGEPMLNVLTDILIGICGGAIGYLYVRSFHLAIPSMVGLFIVEVIVLTILAKTGWKNYCRHGK